MRTSIVKFQNFKRLYQSYGKNIRNFCMQFNSEESEKILHTLNSCPEEEFFDIGLPQHFAQKLLSLRIQNGNFKTLNELTTIKGFDLTILQEIIANNVADPPAAIVKSKKTKNSNYTIPGLSAKYKNNFKSCLAVHVGVSSITWARLELNECKPCSLNNWQHYNIPNNRMHLKDMIEKCLHLDQLLPESDCYVFENPPIATSSTLANAAQFNINVQKAQLTAVLGFALAKRGYLDENENLQINRLFYMKNLLASKLFKTVVGNEKVATDQVVMELLRTHYNICDENSMNESISLNDEMSEIEGKITVSQHLRDLFSQSKGFEKEFLGQSLLLCLAFTRLCLLKCPKSIALLE